MLFHLLYRILLYTLLLAYNRIIDNRSWDTASCQCSHHRSIDRSIETYQSTGTPNEAITVSVRLRKSFMALFDLCFFFLRFIAREIIHICISRMLTIHFTIILNAAFTLSNVFESNIRISARSVPSEYSVLSRQGTLHDEITRFVGGRAARARSPCQART